MVGPLTGVRVLDFTTRLPGPLATFLLQQAGAEVCKIESPAGDTLDQSTPLWPEAPDMYAALNGRKRVERFDLSAAAERARLLPLVAQADVVVEGFRPGVMARFDLDYERVARKNPRIVYCSLTGYGQTGPRRNRAGHDLSYLAESGVLSLLANADGDPVVPGALIADIAAGSFCAVTDIALALYAREKTGRGAFLDCAMSDNLATFAMWGVVNGTSSGRWPRPASDLFTGSSPRYRCYRTADGRWLAVAALEPQFWDRFCDAVGLESDARNDARDPAATAAAVAVRVAAHDATHWRALFTEVDACCAIVDTVKEAFANGTLCDPR
jgi:alpha-methylacyl-CoA racemase